MLLIHARERERENLLPSILYFERSTTYIHTYIRSEFDVQPKYNNDNNNSKYSSRSPIETGSMVGEGACMCKKKEKNIYIHVRKKNHESMTLRSFSVSKQATNLFCA